MDIKEKDNETYFTLIPVGDLDANSSMEMDEKIREVLAKGQPRIHIDCGELTYISSAGLGVFISFMEELRDLEGKFVFSDMPANISKVFELLGLHQIMQIVESRNQVSEAFAA